MCEKPLVSILGFTRFYPVPTPYNSAESSMTITCVQHLNEEQIDGSYVEYVVVIGHSVRPKKLQNVRLVWVLWAFSASNKS